MAIAAQASRRSAVTFVKWVILASIPLSLVQLMLGADPVILLLCIATEAVCLAPILLYGLERTVGVLLLYVWLTFSFSSLAAKTVLLQPIESNLFNPFLTFTAQLAGACCISIAAFISYNIKFLHKNSITPVLDPKILSILGFILYITGAVGFILCRFSGQNSITSNIGNILNPLIGYGIVCEISSTIVRTQRRKTFSIYSIFMLAGVLILGVVGNSKSGILLPGLIYILSISAFGGRLRWTTVFAALISIALFSEFLFPAVHIVRNFRDRLNPIEVAGATIGTTFSLIVGDSQALAEKDALNAEADASPDAYRNIYFGSRQVWLDRFVNTGAIDAVARRLSFDGPFLGLGPVVGDTLTGLLPQQLNPNKYTGVQFADGDVIAHAYGLEARDGQGAATVPMPIELFAADGFFGIFIVGIPLITLIFVEVNMLVFDFKNNPWGVCFIVFYGMSFYEATHDMYAFMAARQMPFDFLAISLAIMLATTIKHGLPTAGASRGARSSPAF